MLDVFRMTSDVHWIQGNNIKIFGQRGTTENWVNSQHSLTVCKAIITRESAQGSLSNIGLISSNILNLLQGNNMKRFVPRGTKAHYFNTYQFFTGCKTII